MNLTQEQLKIVKEMAYRLISPELIAINLEVDVYDFKMTLEADGPIRNAFFSGYLQQLIETRDALIKSAHNGSNPAQLELLKFIRDLNRQMKYG